MKNRPVMAGFFFVRKKVSNGKWLKVGALRPTGQTGHANSSFFTCDT
jgi:hypothetical protein